MVIGSIIKLFVESFIEPFLEFFITSFIEFFIESMTPLSNLSLVPDIVDSSKVGAGKFSGSVTDQQYSLEAQTLINICDVNTTKYFKLPQI